MASQEMTLVVAGFRAEARDIVLVELRDPNGGSLPPFEPGAHLEITLPKAPGAQLALIRHYSLSSDSADTARYVIAIGRAPDSRGGSSLIHEQLRVGTVMRVKGPSNNFPLVSNASGYRFIAGGIGITPIMSMIRWCVANRREWSLLYLTRSRVCTAFYEELCGYGKRVKFHFSDEAGGRLDDLRNLLSKFNVDDHIYCCGPGPLMKAVEQETRDRQDGTVHFEWFSANSAPEPEKVTEGFDVLLRRSGIAVHVNCKATILEALEDRGIDVPFSCREGLCRTCEVNICAGEADHRDFVLSHDERTAQKVMLICVSRAKTANLEIDL